MSFPKYGTHGKTGNDSVRSRIAGPRMKGKLQGVYKGSSERVKKQELKPTDTTLHLMLIPLRFIATSELQRSLNRKSNDPYRASVGYLNPLLATDH